MKNLTLFILVIFLVAALSGCSKKETTPTDPDTTTVPTVSTSAVDSIEYNTAKSGGIVIYDGGKMVTARGVCWNTDTNVSVSANKTVDGLGEGSFTSKMTGLNTGTTYYVRAYATNDKGTGYGMIKSFKTSTVPVLTTNPVTLITSVSGATGGNITSDGGMPVTSRGVCWSKNPHPSTSDSMAVQGSGVGIFSCSIFGLTPKTKYYVRAFATSAAGTAYGDTVSFTTKNASTNYNLVNLFQWNGTPANGYYQNFNFGYGVVYDLSTYPEAILKKLDFHHASWGTMGIWQYKIHIIDYAAAAEVAVTGTFTTTGNDHWENNISLGDLEGLGGRQIAILLEPLSGDPADAYPILSSDNIGPDGTSVLVRLDSLAAMQPSGIGDFLQNLWIGVPFKDGMQTIVPRKITVGELFKSSKQPVRWNSLGRTRK